MTKAPSERFLNVRTLNTVRDRPIPVTTSAPKWERLPTANVFAVFIRHDSSVSPTSKDC